ncbi:hypothetical protein V6N11_050385 [Hibiscus sabdariffa]|uniref:Uncharacterized protein n=1 Tax=Hibiscus sabdariffa TaxID=183260 RepID=A0ABR2T9N2_9ROSI
MQRESSRTMAVEALQELFTDDGQPKKGPRTQNEALAYHKMNFAHHQLPFLLLFCHIRLGFIAGVTGRCRFKNCRQPRSSKPFKIYVTHYEPFSGYRVVACNISSCCIIQAYMMAEMKCNKKFLIFFISISDRVHFVGDPTRFLAQTTNNQVNKMHLKGDRNTQLTLQWEDAFLSKAHNEMNNMN